MAAETKKARQQKSAASSLRFVRSRADFRRLTAHMGLMFSDFATTPDNVQHTSHATDTKALAEANYSSFVSFGLSFSAVRTGLPFDFALQPGLVHVATRRRLSELVGSDVDASPEHTAKVAMRECHA